MLDLGNGYMLCYGFIKDAKKVFTFRALRRNIYQIFSFAIFCRLAVEQNVGPETTICLKFSICS